MAILNEKGRNTQPVVSRIPKVLAHRINAMAEKEGVPLSGFLRLFIEECYPAWEEKVKDARAQRNADMLQSAREMKKRVEALLDLTDEKDAGSAGEQPARGSQSDRSVDPVTSDGNRVSSMGWLDSLIAGPIANHAPRPNTLGGHL